MIKISWNFEAYCLTKQSRLPVPIPSTFRQDSHLVLEVIFLGFYMLSTVPNLVWKRTSWNCIFLSPDRFICRFPIPQIRESTCTPFHPFADFFADTHQKSPLFADRSASDSRKQGNSNDNFIVKWLWKEHT